MFPSRGHVFFCRQLHVNISYSTKNIPLPSRSDYVQRLIEKTKQFLRRIRWKAHFFLNPDTAFVFKGNLRLQINQKSTSHRRIKRLRERHAKDIQSVKFKQVNNPSLNKLKEDTDRIKKGTQATNRRRRNN